MYFMGIHVFLLCKTPVLVISALKIPAQLQDQNEPAYKPEWGSGSHVLCGKDLRPGKKYTNAVLRTSLLEFVLGHGHVSLDN